MFVNYAHRGASSYYPENTLSSFYAGIDMKANGIETDIHRTKDGILVLFHDDTLERVTDMSGPITDYTYRELLETVVYNPGRDRVDKILKFEDFLKYFSYRDITFAVELKQDLVEEQTIDLLNHYNMVEKTILTSFNFDSIRNAKKYDPRYRVGYLYYDDKEALEKVQSIGGEELCPKAEYVTQDTVNRFHALGFSVRPWGISDEEIMKRMYDFGADGMTVNFPDKLTAYIAEKKTLAAS